MGVVGEQPVLDLNYDEDSKAKVDMNLVMTGGGKYVELQGTGEEAPFDRRELNAMLELGEQGILEMIERQKEVLGPIALKIGARGLGEA